jgi:DNA-3-methyladenine glycosylase
MRARRGGGADRHLCNGPGRLSEALGLSGSHDGADPTVQPLALLPPSGPVAFTTTPRIGISRATDQPWRFVEAGSRGSR